MEETPASQGRFSTACGAASSRIPPGESKRIPPPVPGKDEPINIAWPSDANSLETSVDGSHTSSTERQGVEDSNVFGPSKAAPSSTKPKVLLKDAQAVSKAPPVNRHSPNFKEKLDLFKEFVKEHPVSEAPSAPSRPDCKATTFHREEPQKRTSTVSFHPVASVAFGDDEPDTQGPALNAALPIHSITTSASEEEAPERHSSKIHHHNHKKHMNSRLTLSAFRRSAVRLTRADPDRRLEDYYEIRNTGQSAILGHGAFSTVRMAVRRADQLPVAVKSIAKHEALRARRLRVGKHGLEEWDILRKMRSHPFIINLMELFETEDEIILVLEYCKGGELFNAIQRRRNRRQAMRRGQYTESQAAVITSQILKALKDLHAAGIVHRDVKPENILLTESSDDRIRVKLCDFGMARSLREEDLSAMGSSSEDGGMQEASGKATPTTPGRSRAYSIVGSNYYVAPEITYGNPYDSAVDIYSLGVTLYILLCGFPPCFSGPNSDEVIFPHSYWCDVSEDAKQLVKRMLHRSPLERITAQEALRDKWIWQHLQYHKHRPSILKPRMARFASPDRCSRLDVVRNQLYESLTLQASMKRGAMPPPAMSAKRRRNNPRSSSATLLALADLYRDVAQSPAAKMLPVDAKDVSGAPKTPIPDAAPGFAKCTSPVRPLSV